MMRCSSETNTQPTCNRWQVERAESNQATDIKYSCQEGRCGNPRTHAFKTSNSVTSSDIQPFTFLENSITSEVWQQAFLCRTASRPERFAKFSRSGIDKNVSGWKTFPKAAVVSWRATTSVISIRRVSPLSARANRSGRLRAEHSLNPASAGGSVVFT